MTISKKSSEANILNFASPDESELKIIDTELNFEFDRTYNTFAKYHKK